MMDFELDLERLNTETTFVKDDKLNQHHERFEKSVISKVVLNGKDPLEEEYRIYQLQIERGRLPCGSDIFQSVLGEFVKSKTVEFSLDVNKVRNNNGRITPNKSRRGSKHSNNTTEDTNR